MDAPLEMHIEEKKKDEKKGKLSNWMEVKKEHGLNW